jgi:7-keto-8-aminopelargonate synthetase-like enzyme
MSEPFSASLTAIGAFVLGVAAWAKNRVKPEPPDASAAALAAAALDAAIDSRNHWCRLADEYADYIAAQNRQIEALNYRIDTLESDLMRLRTGGHSDALQLIDARLDQYLGVETPAAQPPMVTSPAGLVAAARAMCKCSPSRTDMLTRAYRMAPIVGQVTT